MTKTAEEQRKRQLEYKDFDLIVAKITKDGVDVAHHEAGADAGTIKKSGEVQEA
jgi:hypothetical protein